METMDDATEVDSLTAERIAALVPSDVYGITGGYDERCIDALLGDLSRSCVPRIQTVDEWLEIATSAPIHISFGCPLLDAVCGGGLPVCGITEIGGAAGAGKTQLCLQLMLQVQLPVQEGGLNGSVVHIGTDTPFPHDRYEQMQEAFRRGHPSMSIDRMRDAVLYTRAITADSLWETVNGLLPAVLRRRSTVRLIVIDSIASIYRSDWAANSAAGLTERAHHFDALAHRLNELGRQYKAAIICVNQAAADMSVLGGGGGSTAMGDEAVRAALGLAWERCITSRFWVSRTTLHWSHADDDYDDAEPPPKRARAAPSIRYFDVHFAPHLRRARQAFVIGASGVRGVELD